MYRQGSGRRGSGMRTPLNLEDVRPVRETAIREGNTVRTGSGDIINTNENDTDLGYILGLDKGEFYLTGSRAWGTNQVYSDIDLICSPNTYNELLEKIKRLNFEYIEHEAYKALYIRGYDGVYNIICLSEFDMECWYFATESIKAMLETETITKGDIKNKSFFLGFFEQLCLINRSRLTTRKIM